MKAEWFQTFSQEDRREEGFLSRSVFNNACARIFPVLSAEERHTLMHFYDFPACDRVRYREFLFLSGKSSSSRPWLRGRNNSSSGRGKTGVRPPSLVTQRWSERGRVEKAEDDEERDEEDVEGGGLRYECTLVLHVCMYVYMRMKN